MPELSTHIRLWFFCEHFSFNGTGAMLSHDFVHPMLHCLYDHWFQEVSQQLNVRTASECITCSEIIIALFLGNLIKDKLS